MVASAISWRIAPFGDALALLPEDARRELLACFALVRLAVEAEFFAPTTSEDPPALRAAVCARLTWMRVASTHPVAASALNQELLALGEAQITQRLDPADDLVVRFQRLDEKAAAWVTTDEALTHWVLELAVLDVALLMLLMASEEPGDDDLQGAARSGVDALLDDVDALLDGPPPGHHAQLEGPRPTEFVALAHAAFAERPELAHAIIELGARWYPEDVVVGAARSLFALPVARTVPMRSDAGGRARNLAWLRAHEQEYTGQWVVLVDGQILGHGDDLDEVASGLGGLPRAAMLVRAGA